MSDVTELTAEAHNRAMVEAFAIPDDCCQACGQPLVACLGCGRERGAWPDRYSRADYCSDRCRATTKKRRHRARA